MKKDFVIVLVCAGFMLAILGAVGSSGRRRAKEAVCFCNLHKWGLVWKSYTDDHGGYFPDRSSFPISGDSMMYWPHITKPYYKQRAMLFCPEATKPYEAGGVPPFAAWTVQFDVERQPIYYGSYGINLWVANEDAAKFWRTFKVRDAAFAPLMLDSNWKDAEPELYDEAPPYDGYWWEPSGNEMQRVCLNRHNDRHNGRVNALFLDMSVRKTNLKNLWKLKWHKEWCLDAGPASGWPDWMGDLPE